MAIGNYIAVGTFEVKEPLLIFYAALCICSSCDTQLLLMTSSITCSSILYARSYTHSCILYTANKNIQLFSSKPRSFSYNPVACN